MLSGRPAAAASSVVVSTYLLRPLRPWSVGEPYASGLLRPPLPITSGYVPLHVVPVTSNSFGAADDASG